MGKKGRRSKRLAERPGESEPRIRSVPPAPTARPPSIDPERVACERLVLVSILLALVVAGFYLPALDGRFINWDDPDYVTANPAIATLSWKTVGWAFTTFATGNWHPVTWLSLALDHRLYGLDPWGYHLTNLALHVANSVLVLLVLQGLTGSLWKSAAVAALFGLHPLHVESVAWVAERKDVLCAFFWLLTLAAYARWVRVPSWSSYLVVALTTALALLAKPMAITLPFALLLLDWWPLRRLSWRTVAEKVPLVALAAGEAIATFFAQSAEGAVAIDPIPFRARASNAVVAYARYLALTVRPLRLSPWYSHPAVEGPPLSPWTVVAAIALLAAITALALSNARRRPYLAVGWLWYLGTLVPVIGLLQAGRQSMADRFAYIPHVGLFLAIVWGIGSLPGWDHRSARAAGAAMLAVILAWLGVLTFRQTAVWHDSTTFWTYTAETNPYAFIAHQALGGILNEAGHTDAALRQFLIARRLRPDIAVVHKNVGALLIRQRRYAAAAASYRKAVALRPDSADYETTLGDVLLRQGRPAQARRHLERAITLRPGSAEAHDGLGRALLASGQLDDAIAEFRRALALKPALADAQRGLDDALARHARASAS
jgi:protein O-mannosyl-transferase